MSNGCYIADLIDGLPEWKDIEKAVKIIREGGVIVFPAETLYGFSADPWNKSAIEKISRIKGRQESGRYILLVKDINMLKSLTEEPEIRNIAEIFTKLFYGCPITFVLTARSDVPAWIRGSMNSAALRIASDPVAEKLTACLNSPIVSTSVNRTGMKPFTDPEEILRLFGDEIDLIFKGARRFLDKPSTVIDLRGEKLVILRRGAVKAEDIASRLEEHAPEIAGKFKFDM